MDSRRQTNAYVRRMVQNNHWGTAGSTIMLAAVLDDTCIAANLGDSPLFHYQAATGQLHRVTDDHGGRCAAARWRDHARDGALPRGAQPAGVLPRRRELADHSNSF